MKTGAVLRIATDIPDYVRQSLQEVMKHNFSWMASDALDWRECWSDWISTRYEIKALLEGRKPYYLTFEKRES
jgi:tRNA (guanine-N7-)-methyltransferase